MVCGAVAEKARRGARERALVCVFARVCVCVYGWGVRVRSCASVGVGV